MKGKIKNGLLPLLSLAVPLILTGVIQSVFAEYLNASPSTIKKWETGEKRPTGTALKLLNLVAEKGLGVLVSGE